jgi:HAD superfamily hydrolase (TIGR01509 family)
MGYSWAPGSGRRSTWAVSRRVLVKDTANGIDLSFSSGAQLREFMTRKNEYYLQSVRDITPRALLLGARELLQEIHSAGIKLALGSASKNAPEVIDRLGIRAFFDAIADGHSVERQKPAPDLFLHAAAQLHLPPQECAVVEDAEAGIQAAKAGGFWAVGLGPPERVRGADAVLPSLEKVHLADIIQALGYNGAARG